MKKKLLAYIMTACMLTGLLPMTAVAAGCGHDHTCAKEVCGYVAAEAGTDCTHACGDDCYTVQTVCKHNCPDESCGFVAGTEEAEGAPCTHTCGEECTEKVENCKHKHNEECGYAAPVIGVECGYVCEACAAANLEEPVVCDHEYGAWDWDENKGVFVRECDECDASEESNGPDVVYEIMMEEDPAEAIADAEEDGIITSTVATMLLITLGVDPTGIPQGAVKITNITNPYDGIVIEEAYVQDGVGIVKVSYAKANQMAGIGYSYTSADGTVIEDRAIAQQIDENGVPQTDKNNVAGTIRDCTVYKLNGLPADAKASGIKITVEGNTTWNYADGKLTISGEGKMADFTYTTISDAAATIDGRGIMTFPWADHQLDIEEVVIKDGITYIGKQAFRKHINMTTLKVESDDLVEIANTLCMNNTSLVLVDLSACADLEYVGDGAFRPIAPDSKIVAAKYVAGLWRNAGNYDNANTTIEYLAGGENVFTADVWSVEVLADGTSCRLAKYNGTGGDVVIPAKVTANEKTYTVTELNTGLFNGNTNVTSISFAEGSEITELPATFLAGANNLTSIILPAGITKVGQSALGTASTKLATLQFGSNADIIDLTHVAELGKQSFANSRGTAIQKKEVHISSALKVLGTDVFRNNIYSKLVLEDGDYAHVEVAEDAFWGNNKPDYSLKLTNGLEMKAGVKNADDIIKALLFAEKVTTFTQLYENTDGSEGSVVYTVNYADDTVSVGIDTDKVSKSDIPAEWYGLKTVVSSVGEEITSGDWRILAADGECTILGYVGDFSALTDGTLVIPKAIDSYTVTAIGDNAFYTADAMASLKKVTFESESQCKEIGEGAFRGEGSSNARTALLSVVLPDTVEVIGNNAFYACTKLSMDKLPANLKVIGNRAFQYNTINAGIATLPASVTSVGTAAYRWAYAVDHIKIQSETLALTTESFYTSGLSADMTAVKDLKITGENVFLMNTGENIKPIYVANAEIAAAVDKAVDYNYNNNDRLTCIVVVNGGTVGASPTGLGNVTRDGYTAEWYTDADFTQPVTDTADNKLATETIYYAKWVKSSGEGGFTVDDIPAVTYTGAAKNPNVVVKDASGNVLTEDQYTVTFKRGTEETENFISAGKITVEVTVPEKGTVSLAYVIEKATDVTLGVTAPTKEYDGTAYNISEIVYDPSVSVGTGVITAEYYTDADCTTKVVGDMVNVGTYYVKVILADTADHAGAEAVVPVTITPAGMIADVTATGYAGTYDGLGHAITVTAGEGATVTYSVDGENYDAENPSFTNAGEHYVYYKVTKDNYDEFNGHAIVQIDKAELTAKYISEIIRVGRTPALMVEITGFVNGETANVLSAVPVVTTNATDIGTYTLTPSGGAADNYTFAYESGTLTIKKKSSGGSSKPSTETGKEEKPEETPVETPEETPAETPAEEGVAQESVVLTIGNVVAMVDGMPVVNDVAPVIRNERTMLPIRFVAEALGADVAWDDDADKVTITKGDVVIEIFIGQPFALVNGNPVQLDAAAFIENGRTYLPLRFVAEVLGATVLWDANTNTVTIIPNK